MSEPSHYDKHVCNFIKTIAPAIAISYLAAMAMPLLHHKKWIISTDHLFH